MADPLFKRLPIFAIALVTIAAAITLPIVLINRNPTTSPSTSASVTAANAPLSSPDVDPLLASPDESPDELATDLPQPTSEPSLSDPTPSIRPDVTVVPLSSPSASVQPSTQPSTQPSPSPTPSISSSTSPSPTPSSAPSSPPSTSPSTTPSPVPPPAPPLAAASAPSATPTASSSPSPSQSNDLAAQSSADAAQSSADAAQSSAEDPHLLLHPHFAHAVPGLHYIVDDVDNDNEELVPLDASRSHSHYFQPPSTVASIDSWVWRYLNGTLLLNSSTPILPFPIGTTVLNLTVRDNFGHTHSDLTNVTVRPSARPGFFCYFYPGVTSSDDPFTLDTNPVVGVKPIRGELYPSIDFTAPNQLPDVVASRAMQVRCTFHIQSAEARVVNLQLQHRGPLRLLKQTTGADYAPVISRNGDGPVRNASAQVEVPAGGLAFQIWYYRPSGQSEVTLRLLQGGLGAVHELSTQLPLIHSITPRNSTLAGGGLLTVYGSGLWNDPQVYFGDNPVSPIADRSDRTKLTVAVPSATEAGDIPITLGNRFGGSNAINFRYSPDGLSPIMFEELRVSDTSNGTFGVKLVTNIKLGPDHRYYLASLDSFVYSVSISRELVASDMCTSPSLGRSRTVIGLAFNPADTDVLLYASSSVIFWGREGQPPTGDVPWANGLVHKLRPGHNGECLGVIDEPVISGLPVSNHDHGVNGLLFDDDGRLLIMVGSATNAGVKDITVGEIDESPLSAACLIADVNAAGFDGRILYDSADAVTARVASGDVKVYSPGWRNSFELTQHSNGFIYATENGANSEFGNRSLTCNTEAPISPYQSDDKIAKVLHGRYGGHANRNRARDNPVECTWRSPFDAATNTYNPPIATVESSTDGIIEYTADVFGGQLKGNLLMSKYSSNDPNDSGKVYRVRVDAGGERNGPVDSLWEASGLSIVMTAWGDVLMPQLYNEEVMALRPRFEEMKRGRLIAVTPTRGPLGGGNEVLVTGFGFGSGAVALFNGEACRDVREASEDSFKCDVPGGQAGAASVAIRLSDGTVVASSPGADYRYMRV